MSDFFQNGTITTLPRLSSESPMDCEDRSDKKVVLLLPALFSEFERDAMPEILEQLRTADYLHGIIVSLDRADEPQFHLVRSVLSQLPCQTWILWNDGPGVLQLLEEMQARGLETAEQGKGRGVWLSLGFALYGLQADVVALHDCDILTYRRSLLDRLVMPLVQPEARFEFVKGFYARAGKDCLNGRVTRLFFTPFVRTLQKLLPDERLLSFMDSFRYPLAGEFALSSQLARQLRIAPDWGREVSLLEEVFDYTTRQRVCQAEIADDYDHKHQDLGEADSGLAGMATEITAHLFTATTRRGLVLSNDVIDTLLATYQRQAREAIERYESVARFNGLDYDRHREEEAAEVFETSIVQAWETLRQNGKLVRLASWDSISRNDPTIIGRLCGAAIEVELPWENREEAEYEPHHPESTDEYLRPIQVVAAE